MPAIRVTEGSKYLANLPMSQNYAEAVAHAFDKVKKIAKFFEATVNIYSG